MAILLTQIVNAIFKILQIAIILECIASWIPQLKYNSLMDIVYKVTNPILEPIREMQNRFIQGLPIDFSPIIAFLVIGVLRNLIIQVVWIIF